MSASLGNSEPPGAVRSVGADEVRTALARPGFYMHPVDRVELRETHISWVFLVGDRAYKLKKPLVLPFLDYGSPARRGEMCREEVRLNSRLAPNVYLGVRAVVECAGGFELAAEDDPRAVDYVVEMRRYDEECTLAARLERGEVKQSQIVEVGRRLAVFHQQARRVPAPGVPALAVERRMTENFHELLAIVEQRAEIEWVLALERFTHAFLVAHVQMLDTRARRRLIREVHGDLRAEHVLLGDPIEIVDCIEFDDRLRELDVADDLAFLVMDLVARGGERLAQTLLSAYRNAGGDLGDDQLIAFYAAHRALVRAKVTLMRAAQHPASTSAAAHESSLARDLLSLAERFAWRARLPLVIVICGSPASGKTQLAQALAEISHLPHLSSDVTRKEIAGVEPQQRAGCEFYSSEFSQLTYSELGRRARQATKACGGAIVDATFRCRSYRSAFTASFADAAPLLFVECWAPAGVLASRAARRDRQTDGVSDASLSVVVRESAAWEPLGELPPEAHVTLRSDRRVEAQLEDLRALLDRRIGPLNERRSEPPTVAEAALGETARSHARGPRETPDGCMLRSE